MNYLLVDINIILVYPTLSLIFRGYPSDLLDRPSYPQAMLFVQKVVDLGDEMSSLSLHKPVIVQLPQNRRKEP
jgi:hypothetical protein